MFRLFERLFEHALGGGLLTGSSADTRPDLDDTIRLLTPSFTVWGWDGDGGLV